jgi:hypothetical protein
MYGTIVIEFSHVLNGAGIDFGASRFRKHYFVSNTRRRCWVIVEQAMLKEKVKQ